MRANSIQVALNKYSHKTHLWHPMLIKMETCENNLRRQQLWKCINASRSLNSSELNLSNSYWKTELKMRDMLNQLYSQFKSMQCKLKWMQMFWLIYMLHFSSGILNHFSCTFFQTCSGGMWFPGCWPKNTCWCRQWTILRKMTLCLTYSSN